MMVRYYPDELMHYGIEGMKWGIRRYQNKDGTRTPLGKARERKENGTGKKIAKGAGAAVGVLAGANLLGRAVTKNRGLKKLTEEEKDYLFNEDQKNGKDKAPISRAEKIGKKVSETGRGVSKITGKVESKRSARSDYERREELRRQASRMSDDDLRKRINRMNLEKQYVDLSSYKTDSGRWSAQDKMDLGLDAIEVLAGLGSLAVSLYGVKRKLHL